MKYSKKNFYCESDGFLDGVFTLQRFGYFLNSRAQKRSQFLYRHIFPEHGVSFGFKNITLLNAGVHHKRRYQTLRSLLLLFITLYYIPTYILAHYLISYIIIIYYHPIFLIVLLVVPLIKSNE